MKIQPKIKKNIQEQKTEYEIWKNIIPKNNNLKETYELQISYLDDVILINQQSYTKKDYIGKGFYGEVQKFQNKNLNEYFACKIFKRSVLNNTVIINNEPIKIEEFILKELVAAKLLKNDNLTIAHELIDDQKAENIQLIMELCQGEFCSFNERAMKFNNSYFISDSITNSLFTKKYLNLKKVKKAFRQLTEGVLYLHNLDLAHCDLKPQNILSKDGNIKIADFGSLAWTDPTNHLKSTVDNGFGTPYFHAPESLFTKDKTNINKFKLDIWALGITFFAFAFGFLPFDVKFINNSVIPINFIINWNNVEDHQQQPADLREFIELILVLDFRQRPSIYELIKHEYLVQEEDVQYLCNNYCFNQTDTKNQDTTNFSNFFFNIYGLNCENMVEDSIQDQHGVPNTCSKQSRNGTLNLSSNNKISNEKKLSDKKRSYNYKRSNSVDFQDSINNILSPTKENRLKNSQTISIIIKDISKTSICEEHQMKFNQFNPDSKQQEQDNPDRKIDDKFDRNINQDQKQTMTSKNSEINKFVSGNIESNIEFNTLNLSQKANELLNLFKSQENSNSIDKILQTTPCLNDNDMKSNDLDIKSSRISRRSSIVQNDIYQQSYSKLINVINQYKLFDMIYETINHKQRVNIKNFEEVNSCRRKSDSNILDVIELKNYFNCKDHIIQECIKQIDLEKHSKLI